MLKQLRNDFKKYSWTLWLVIITFLIGFSFFDAFSGKSRAKDGLIFLGDEVIKAEEYQKQLTMMLQLYKQQFKDNFNKKFINQMGIPERVLQNLINSNVIRTEADKMDITASKDELKQKILNHPWFQRDGKFVGLQNYQYFINRYFGIETKVFEKQLIDEIIAEKFQALITTGMVIDDATLLEKFKDEKDSAELEYIMLKPARVKEKIEIGDSALEAYYNEHKEDFKSPERRAGYAVALKFEDFKKDINIKPNEVYDYFKTNKEQFVEQAKTKVSRIMLNYTAENRDAILKKAQDLQQDLTKENFAEKAKRFSQDAKATAGGDHGYFAWQRFTKPETTIINTMEQDEISSPVDTKAGFAIFWISEKTAKRQKEFAKVKDVINGTIEREKLNTLVSEKLAKIHKKVKSLPDMKAKADSLGLKVIDTGLLASGGAIKDVDRSGYISRQLFQLKEKEVSDPFTMPDGMALVQLISIEAPAVEPLDKVKAKVTNAAVQAEKLQRLALEAKTLSAELNKLSDEKAIKEFVESKELTTTTATYKRGDKLGYLPVQEGLDDKIFGMDEQKYSEPIDFKTEIAIVKVKSKEITSDVDFAKEKPEFYARKVDEIKNSYFSSFIYNKRENYDVRINQELYQEVKTKALSRIN